VSLNELSSDPYRYQILLDLLGRINGSISDIGSMFQNLDASAVTSVFTEEKYGECQNDWRRCVAPINAQTGWAMDLSDMDNINQMGNVAGIADQVFQPYNVGQGGNSGGNNPLSSLFGMFGNGNMGNGNLLGTMLTVLGL